MAVFIWVGNLNPSQLTKSHENVVLTIWLEKFWRNREKYISQQIVLFCTYIAETGSTSE
jgi:hypothetical protein